MPERSCSALARSATMGKKREKGSNDAGLGRLEEDLRERIAAGKAVGALKYEDMGRNNAPRVDLLESEIPLLRVLHASCPKLRPPFSQLKQLFLQVI